MRRAAAALAAAALLGGCGTPSADLFVVHRTGSIPGARLTLLVSDGGFVDCNGGRDRDMSDPLLLDARELARDLEKYAKRSLRLPPGPGSVLTYSVRLEDGTVRFSDTSPRQPPVFRRMALFVREVAKGSCGLAR